MVGEVQVPITVTSAQGVTDLLQAVMSYAVIIVGFISGLAALIGKHDAASAVSYVQTNLGGAVAAIFGLVAIGTMVWRLYKTFKRGSQVASLAASPEVPNHLAHLSQ